VHGERLAGPRYSPRSGRVVYSSAGFSGHIVRLNSEAGTPVSSVNCDRPLHSGLVALGCDRCWPHG